MLDAGPAGTDVVHDAQAWRRAFWAMAAIFCAGMAYTTVPTPLYPIYQAKEGYGDATITVVFAVYPLGVVASVFLLGHVSDVIGRRRALVPALTLEAVSAGAFVLSDALGVLLAARIVCGIGVGILTATAAAYLSDLDRRARPGVGRRADRVATAATLGGFGLGALSSGLIATVAASPLALPYAVFLALIVTAGAVASRLPETVTPCRSGDQAPGDEPARIRSWLRMQRVVVPPQGRRTFFAACACGFGAFSLLSLLTALAPSFLDQALHEHSPALAGVVTFACCAAAGLGQVALARLPPRDVVGLALVLLPAGIALVAIAVAGASFELFALGMVVGGLGSGALFRRALSTVDEVAPPRARAEAFAGFYLAVYLNGTVPVVALGIVSQAFGALPAVLAYAAMVLAILAAAGPSLLRAATTPVAQPAGAA
jgi:MFS family permease